MSLCARVCISVCVCVCVCVGVCVCVCCTAPAWPDSCPRREEESGSGNEWEDRDALLCLCSPCLAKQEAEIPYNGVYVRVRVLARMRVQ